MRPRNPPDAGGKTRAPCRVHVAWRSREGLEKAGIKGEQTATCATWSRRPSQLRPLIFLKVRPISTRDDADQEDASPSDYERETDRLDAAIRDRSRLQVISPQTRIPQPRTLLMRDFVVWRRLKTEHGDASWCFDGDLVRVVTPYGHKATQLGGSPAVHIARLLMRELAGQHKLKSKGI